MPTPVAFLLNSRLTTLILVFSFSSGSRLLPSSMSAPAPLAQKWLPLIPHPMNRAANRLGSGASEPFVTVSAPQTGTDSSHGRAIVTPTPRRKVRRCMVDCSKPRHLTTEAQRHRADNRSFFLSALCLCASVVNLLSLVDTETACLSRSLPP